VETYLQAGGRGLEGASGGIWSCKAILWSKCSKVEECLPSWIRLVNKFLNCNFLNPGVTPGCCTTTSTIRIRWSPLSCLRNVAVASSARAVYGLTSTCEVWAYCLLASCRPGNRRASAGRWMLWSSWWATGKWTWWTIMSASSTSYSRDPPTVRPRQIRCMHCYVRIIFVAVNGVQREL